MEENKALTAKEFCEFLRKNPNKFISALRVSKYNEAGTLATVWVYYYDGNMLYKDDFWDRHKSAMDEYESSVSKKPFEELRFKVIRVNNTPEDGKDKFLRKFK